MTAGGDGGWDVGEAGREPAAAPAGNPGPASESDLDPERASERHPDRIRAVLLDLGGVVLDLGEARGLPWGELERRGREELLALLRESGGRASEEDLDRLLFGPWRREHARRRRRGREARWRPHFERLTRACAAGAPAERLFTAWAGPYLGGLRPVSGAQEALARLVSGDLALALVANVPLPGSSYRRVLEDQGLAAFFESLHFSYDTGARLPGPLLVRAALEALGAEPDQAVLVGDRRSTGVAAGRAAGVATVWVRGPDAAGPEPDAEIGSIVELPELLEV